MPAQLTIDQFFTKNPKRKAGKNAKSQEKEASPPKKRKVTHLPSPPLTLSKTRPRTPSPTPGPSRPLLPLSPAKNTSPICTPKKHKPAPQGSPFKVPAVPRRVNTDEHEDDVVVPSSQTQSLLLSPIISNSIVPSSQTQLLVYSPERPKRLNLRSPYRPGPNPMQQQRKITDEEIVPSSQSLEHELDMYIPGASPARTQSSAWSQIRSCDGDVFADDDLPFPRTTSPLSIADDGSETEPESEAEGGPPTSAPRTPHRVRKWYSESLSQPESVHSTPKPQRPLGQSASTGSMGEGLSVPDFIKDMNTMLGGAGSYPDDFPMSLRDI